MTHHFFLFISVKDLATNTASTLRVAARVTTTRTNITHRRRRHENVAGQRRANVAGRRREITVIQSTEIATGDVLKILLDSEENSMIGIRTNGPLTAG
jgi:hypothetical protein